MKVDRDCAPQLFFGITLVVTSLPTVSASRGAVVLPDDIRKQIARSSGDVSKIVEYILHGDGRHQTYNRLATLGDKFGPRMTGTRGLEQAVDYVVEEMNKEQLFNVHKESVTVPKWIRGNEYAQLTSPRNRSLPILGLGSSVGTNGTLEADVIVVTSFDELRSLPDDRVVGKIVAYNQPWKGYGQSATYRVSGATEAAKKGAIAALVRSLTPVSIASPHTGHQTYVGDHKIPVACITVEDAEMMQRMQDRGERVTVRLYMEATNAGDITVYNVVAEIPGTEFPNTTVIFGGHIDSWDVGTGSMDDGGGLMISWQTLSVINRLGLRPRRTMRVVLWTAEEQGVVGGAAYFDAHKDEIDRVSLIMESDIGAFKPKGIDFGGSGKALAIMTEIMHQLAPYNASTVLNGSGASSDTGQWVAAGVPGVELYSANENYFYFHHSNGDTMTVLNADDLDLCTVVWATAAYVVSNLDELLPRSGDYPPDDDELRLAIVLAAVVILAAALTLGIGLIVLLVVRRRRRSSKRAGGGSRASSSENSPLIA